MAEAVCDSIYRESTLEPSIYHTAHNPPSSRAGNVCSFCDLAMAKRATGSRQELPSSRLSLQIELRE